MKPAATGRAELVAELGRIRRITSSELRPEFAHRSYRYGTEASVDGREWQSVAPVTDQRGSPIRSPLDANARYLRLIFPEGGAVVWEWVIR